MSKWHVAKSPYLVPFDGSFRIKDAKTAPPDDIAKKEQKDILAEYVDDIRKLQKKLHADNRYAALFIFQALDAAGKDGTIRAVFTGVNPAGFRVHNFNKPTEIQLDHDFLWRIAKRVPDRGRIGVFNRSHYEEVLIVRVHPEFLQGQRLPSVDLETIWDERLDSIRDFELHQARNGMVIAKFFLNVSQGEQRRRLLDRIDEPESNWKFDPRDIEERGHWPDYMHAFEEALNGTSRKWAPWYVIPADNKSYMRATVARIVRDTLASLNLEYPTLSPEGRGALAKGRAILEQEGD